MHRRRPIEKQEDENGRPLMTHEQLHCHLLCKKDNDDDEKEVDMVM